MQAGYPAGVEFALLGPLEVRVSGSPTPVGSVRLQTVLAALLLERGQVVGLDRLITALWEDDPPATARVQAQISISRLRAWLKQQSLPATISTRGNGYLLDVPAGAVDLAQFRQQVAHARQEIGRDAASAAAGLSRALRLWRGDALAGLDNRMIRAAAVRLDEERLTITEEYIDLELSLGRHREVIGQLRQLTAAHPLRERLYGQLMRALYGDGQQAAALEVFRQARRTLQEELGLDPSEELRALERGILEQNLTDATVAIAAGGHPPASVPRQLPAAPRVFVGRDQAVSQIQQLLADRSTPTAAVVLITGAPGVGKTALALHTAHAMAEQFPDGQLFAHLRGGDGRPEPPVGVLGHFLRSLGVAPNMVPAQETERAAMYRSELAGRRVLILLDDAVAAWQVTPLVPGAGGVVIVTARNVLPGLSSHRLDVKVLTPEASRHLLASVVGDSRVDAEPDEAAAVSQACGHLPLALQVAAAKLASRPHWHLGRLARRLADESRRLDELSLDGTGVRASITVSYEALPVPARRLLGLLRLVGATDFAAWVAAPLLDIPADDGLDLVDELVDACLVEVHIGSGRRTRYRLHDLVRAYAREVLVEEPAAIRACAQERLLRCWLFLARQAHRREYGGEYTVLRAGAADWPLPQELADELLPDPLEWFSQEQANLVTAITQAAEIGDAELCVDLAVSSVALFEHRSMLRQWRQTHDLAFAVARRTGHDRAEAVIRCSRAGLALVEHRWSDAVADLTAAKAWFEQAADSHGRGLALRGLGLVDRIQGRTALAYERYQQALVLLRQAGDRAGEAGVLVNLGQLRADEGQLAASEQLLRRALQISADIGERRGEAQARYRLGEVLQACGDLAGAEESLTAAHRLVTATGDLVGIGYALLGLGTVALIREDYHRAEELLTESLVMARRCGNRMNQARALLALAELAISTGDPAASQRLDESDALFTALGAAHWRRRIAALRRRSG